MTSEGRRPRNEEHLQIPGYGSVTAGFDTSSGLLAAQHISLPPELLKMLGFGQPATRPDRSQGYRDFPALRDREIVYAVGKGFAEYAHDNGITTMIYPDSSARNIRKAVTDYWKRTYPDEKTPTSYFLNPQAMQTKDEAVARLRRVWEVSNPDSPTPEILSPERVNELTAATITEIFVGTSGYAISEYLAPHQLIEFNNFLNQERVLSENEIGNFLYRLHHRDRTYMSQQNLLNFMNSGSAASKQAEYLRNTAANEEESADRLAQDLPGLVNHSGEKAMIVDTCLHYGSVVSPIKRNLTTLGFQEVRVGVIANDNHFSSITPDLVIYDTDPFGGCHPLPKDKLTEKKPGNIVSVRVEDKNAKKRGTNVRNEISRIVTEHKEFSLAEDSLVGEKLAKRAAAQRPLDVLCVDQDGTLYLPSDYGQIFTWPNRETVALLEEKSIPVIVNTARPEWNEESETAIEQTMEFTLPDVVIAGNGTSIQWRGKDGILRDDIEYLQRLRDHPITFRESGEMMRFDAMEIGERLMSFINPHTFEGLGDGLITEEGAVSDGTFGLTGLRFEVQNMSYETAARLHDEVIENVDGLRVTISEITKYSDANSFSGWFHIDPSIAGKDFALRHVLTKLREVSGSFADVEDPTINAHVIGDSSVDIPMLTMESSAGKDGYVAYQYGLRNLPPETKRQLEEVIAANKAKRRRKTTRQPHLQLLQSSGPYGVNEVVSQLASMPEEQVNE